MTQTDKVRTQIYHLIYDEREAAKQDIAAKCGLSLPTVSKYLKSLLEEELIRKSGTFSSTGGRLAEIYRCNPDAGIAVGVEITADQLHIASVNLYGDIRMHREHNIPFHHENAYYEKVSSRINVFLHDLNAEKVNFLGITIAIQGIVSPDGQNVIFCGLLNNAKIRKDMFEPYLDIPFDLVHDAEAAGYAELWLHKDLNNALYLSLNRHLGSAVIQNGRMASGTHLGAGVAEHMTLIPDGKPCYCGSRGCADTLLGVNALEEEAGISVEQLFTNLHYNETGAKKVMDDYLKNLATLICNVMMIVEGDVIIGGYLENFLQEEHYQQLSKEIRRRRLLETADIRLIPGFFAHYATVIGAGLLRVRTFLKSI